MKSKKFVALALLVLTSLMSSSAFAQSDRGSITGTVTDPGGALVADAKVTATNLETNEVREANTSGEGSYTLPELKAGPYKLTVEATGFRGVTIENVQVGVQVTRSIDFKLELGEITNVVTVTSDAAPVLQTDSPVRQTNINERQVKELPLQVSAESAGRTPLAFIFLDSNVTSTGDNGGGNSQGTNASRFRVSGGQALGTEILIDGASTRRTQNGTFFSEVAPGPNAFQEFTLSTSTYSAEFGNSSGGIVNFTLKSGTNEFHGEFYDLIRNEVLNANSFRNNAQGLERNRDNQNDFGFNIGGPIPYPNFGEGPGPMFKTTKNRAFFFFNYEGYRFKQGENVILTVPTARMRTGDFSELLTDPYVLAFCRERNQQGVCISSGPVQIYNPRQPSNVREAIVGNRLDLRPELFDPAGFAALQFYPQPNRPGVFDNYVTSSIAPVDMDQYIGKIDLVVSDKQRLSGSYSFRNQPRLQGGFPRFPLPFIAQDVWEQRFKSYFFRLQHDYTFSPTLLNHFNLGFTRYDVANMNTTEGFRTSSLGIPPNATQDVGFPRIGFPGYGQAGNDCATSPDPRCAQNIGSTFFSDRIRDNTWELSDSLTLVKGRHTMKFGGSVRMAQFNVHQRIDLGGSFNFRHDQTAADRDPNGGWPIASLITGATEFSFNFTNSIDPSFKQLTHGYFFQDDIKVTQRLTVNVGLRYDLPGLRLERHGRFRGFDPTATNPVTGRAGALIGAAGQGGLPAEFETLAKPDKSNLGPRLGLAYALNDRTVVRAGIGIYYAPIIYGFEGSNDLNTGLQGYNTASGARTPDGRNARFFLSSYPSIPAVDPNGQFIGSDVQYFDRNFKTGRTVQWSVDFQRELPYNFAASVGYVGHRATRLRSDFGRLNALPLEALRLGFPLLNTNINAVSGTDRAFAQSLGFTIPANGNAVFPGFNGSVAQALRPFPHYNRVNNILESQGVSDYHALQFKLDRRFSQGIQFGLSYTFSSLKTDAAEDLFGGTPLGSVLQNPYDRSSLYAHSPNNPPHVLVFNYLIELPFGKGKKFLDRGGFVDKVFGGWQVGAIHRYQSGTPLSFFTTRGASREFLDFIGFQGNLRLNATGQPIFTGSDVIDNQFRVQVINRSAFAAPPEFGSGGNSNPSGAAIGSAAYRTYYADPLRFFGTLSPTLADVRSDPFLSENLSILKKTRITETLVLELGAEVFNLFNRHRFFSPSTNLDDGNFGFQSIGDDRYYAPRAVQLRIRVMF